MLSQLAKKIYTRWEMMRQAIRMDQLIMEQMQKKPQGLFVKPMVLTTHGIKVSTCETLWKHARCFHTKCGPGFKVNLELIRQINDKKSFFSKTVRVGALFTQDLTKISVSKNQKNQKGKESMMKPPPQPELVAERFELLMFPFSKLCSMQYFPDVGTISIQELSSARTMKRKDTAHSLRWCKATLSPSACSLALATWQVMLFLIPHKPEDKSPLSWHP